MDPTLNTTGKVKSTTFEPGEPYISLPDGGKEDSHKECEADYQKKTEEKKAGKGNGGNFLSPPQLRYVEDHTAMESRPQPEK
ncbi:MAG: hypothetical protein Q9161_007072 [Pseudevernia consocians]